MNGTVTRALAATSGLAERLRAQGVNPEKVFTDLYPFLYAATCFDGGYRDMSIICAALAAAHCGTLKGKRVLDIGSGYGTTTAAIAAYQPREIVAVDNSAPMVRLMTEVLCGAEDLNAWMTTQGADVVLGNLYEGVLDHFNSMRAVFQGGAFRRNGGRLTPRIGDCLELGKNIIGKFDAIIGNNFLHWPVQQWIAAQKKAGTSLTDKELLTGACEAALTQLRLRLNDAGTMILMEPADFITLDDDLKADVDIESHVMTSHPGFRHFHKIVNRILAEEHDITGRKVPVRTTLFNRSELPALMEAGGFKLVQTHHAEWAYTNDPLTVYLSRLGMTLGSIDIPFDAKIAIGKKVREELGGSLTAEERQPNRVHWFFLVLEPQ